MWLIASFADCVMAQDGGFCIWQAPKFPDAAGLYEFSYAVAYSFVHSCIPLHVAACWQQHRERLYCSQASDGVFWLLLYADNSSYGCLYVPIAWRLATPWGTVYNCLVVQYPDDGVVVVHQVASGYGGVPHVRVSAFAGSAWCGHQVTLAIASYYAGVDKNRIHRGSSKSICHH